MTGYSEKSMYILFIVTCGFTIRQSFRTLTVSFATPFNCGRTVAIFSPVLRMRQYLPGAHLSPVTAGRVARLPPRNVPHAVRRKLALDPEGARLQDRRLSLSILPLRDFALRPEVAVVLPPIDATPVKTERLK